MYNNYFTFNQLLENKEYQTLRDTLMEEYDTSNKDIQSVLNYFNQVHFFDNPNDTGYDQAGNLSYIISELGDFIKQHQEYSGKFQCLEISCICHNDDSIPDVGYTMYRFFTKQEQDIHYLTNLKNQIIESFRYGDDSNSWFKGFTDGNSEIIIYQEIGY